VIRIVVTFEQEANRTLVADMLEKNGITVRYRCRTGAETIRAIKKMGGGVVVCGYKFPDMTAEHLAEDLDQRAMFLVLGKSVELDLFDNEDMFRLLMPVRAGELVGAVNLLLQLDQKRSRKMIPKRSQEEEEIIRQAKEVLMTVNHMTEAQAHRYLQRRSMETLTKMTDTARLILTAFE
jgi:hypothetical protein